MNARGILGLVFVTALPVVASTPAQSQEASQGFGASAGVAVLTGSASADYHPGIKIDGSYVMSLQQAVGLRFNLEYARYQAKNGANQGALLGGIANVIYEFGQRRSGPKSYLFSGLGYYRSDEGTRYTAVPNASSSMAFNFGVGYGVLINGNRYFAEARYLSIQSGFFGERLTTLPIVFGVHF